MLIFTPHCPQCCLLKYNFGVCPQDIDLRSQLSSGKKIFLMFSLSFKKISGFLGTCAMATVRVHVCIYVCMYEVSHVCFFHGKRCSMLVRATSSCGVLLLSHLGKGRRRCRGGTGIFIFSLHPCVHLMGLKLCHTLSVLNILLRNAVSTTAVVPLARLNLRLPELRLSSSLT